MGPTAQAANGRPFRLVATDLDGTLLRSDGTVSDRTRTALEVVDSAAVAFVMATGRPPRWMRLVAEQVGHRGLAICSNGAVVYDMGQDRVVTQTLLAPEVGLAVVRAVRDFLPEASFGVEHGDSFGYEPTFSVTGDFGDLYSAPVEKLFGRPAVKLLVRHHDYTVDTLAAKVRQAVGDLAGVTYSGYEPLVEVAVSGVSKAAGLAALCSERGIKPAEVVAFGDMPNDLGMLEWAGLSYAVGTAHPDVLAVVDHRAPGNDDDGVAQVLEQLFGADTLHPPTVPDA